MSQSSTLLNAFNLDDVTDRAVHADLVQDLHGQTTRAGDRVVTVARDGARTARCGQYARPIWVTAIYEATPRKRDGVLTWRRVGSHGLTTAGIGVSGPMVERAMAYAREAGLEYRAGVRHGVQCD